MSVVALTVAPAALISARSYALASGGISGSGGRCAPACRRPGPAEQTDTERARPSRYAVAYGEPGPPGADPLPCSVVDGMRGDSAQVAACRHVPAPRFAQATADRIRHDAARATLGTGLPWERRTAREGGLPGAPGVVHRRSDPNNGLLKTRSIGATRPEVYVSEYGIGLTGARDPLPLR
jgi:hypothetical protein